MILDSLLAGVMLFSSFAARTPNVQPNPDDYVLVSELVIMTFMLIANGKENSESFTLMICFGISLIMFYTLNQNT